MTSGAGRAALAAVVGLVSLGASPPADLRGDLEAIGLALDRAVLQVSRPSRAAAAPRPASRGYRLEGFGAMFVMAPRVLPVPQPTPTAEEREIARTLSQAAQELEARLPRVASDDMRLRLQQSLKAMRQTEADVLLREKMARRAAGDPVSPAEGAHATVPRTLEETLQDLERDVQAMQRIQADAVQAVRGDSLGVPPEVRREIEAQMRLVHQQASAFAAEAERARQEAERAIWSRLGQQPGSPSAPASPAGLPPDTTPLAMLPPWLLWNDPLDDPTPDPQSVIRGVGAAVTAVLEAQGARLRALAPQEQVAVAIDFVPAPRMGARGGAARTLLVRAKKADIDLRAAGQISPAEFRRRVEYVEY